MMKPRARQRGCGFLALIVRRTLQVRLGQTPMLEGERLASSPHRSHESNLPQAESGAAGRNFGGVRECLSECSMGPEGHHDYGVIP